MCTAMSFRSKDHYFGRTLDYERSFGESVVVMPRNFPLTFRALPQLDRHYAMVGMASVAEGYPLYYDGVNEKGLAMAGLLFAGYGKYQPFAQGAENVASFELIPWVLGQCASLREVRQLLERCNLWEEDFSPQLPATPLHWMIADQEGAITVEAVPEGLKIYENPVGVLTNSPDFPYHRTRLADFQRLSPEQGDGYSRGLWSYGLPGDWSSSSRFCRAAFVRKFSRCGEGEAESVSHFFRMLQSVAVPKGCVRVEGGYAHTRYFCCCNQEQGIYYYSTYDDPRIMAVELNASDGEELSVFPVG